MSVERAEPRPRLGAGGLLVALWGVGGVIAVLLQAVSRLLPRALEALPTLGALEWAVVGLWVAFMAYVEGWRGFHLRFAPRVAARALHLGRHPDAVAVALAPAYCMSLFHSTRRQLIVSWALLLGIVALVVLVRQLPQPWRGIVDAGVVVGLGIGTASLLWHGAQGLRGRLPPPDDLPPAARRRDEPAGATDNGR